MTEAARVMASLPVRRRAGAIWRSARATAVYGLSRMKGLPEGAEDLRWALVATLPNSGSTALAKLLSSAPGVGLLTGNGEGQWLVPDLARPAARWQADSPVNYDRVRHVWTRAAMAEGARLAVEKSPSNLVRLVPLTRALGGPDRVSILCFTRDPLAICASWAGRYSRSAIAAEWLGHAPEGWDDDLVFHETLGLICGERMTLLAEAAKTARLVLSYETVTDETDLAASRIAAAFPEASGLDPNAEVAVKDYAAQPLRNMNGEQIAKLTDDQVAAVERGLAKYSDPCAALGYPRGEAT